MNAKSPPPWSNALVASLAIAVCSIAGAAEAPQDRLEASREQFVAALAAVQPGAQSFVQPGDEALSGYPLYPYLQAARLEQALAAATAGEGAADAAARAFLDQHAGEPVAAGVRHNWLASLGRRQLWSAYLAAAPATIGDTALQCLALTARIETGQTVGLAALIVPLYLSSEQLPPDCERPFEWGRSNGVLTEDAIERRVRLILTKGNFRFARLIAKDLSAPRAAPLLKWAALLESPRREIDASIAAREDPVEPAALLGGWTRLVSVDLEYARSRYASLVKARALDREAASPFALALALRLSWNRHPEAIEYFARVHAQDFDEAALEWRARASLWAGDWQGVATAIAAMPQSQADTARWRYWAARAAAATGSLQAARERYGSILTADNFYSAMAAARLEQKLTPNPVPVAADERELSRLAALPGFVRARELQLAGLRNEAFNEWQQAIAAVPPTLQPQGVHLGMRWQWYDVSIATATQQKIFADYPLLYPRPYDTDVAAAAKRAGLPAALVYGVLRQESLYRADAVSSAGAVGLLQMLPETARRTARRAQLPAPRTADLQNPATNIRLGTAHLKELIDQFGGQVPLALAGYNAGPNAARRWLPQRAIDTDIWIENIPFNETRTYIQRILWHSVVFAWLANGQPQETAGWLTQVEPAAGLKLQAAAGNR